MMVSANRSIDYPEDRDRPDLDGTSRMSAHLKFGTIHTGTMAADLGPSDGAEAYLRELAFRDFYAAVLHERPESACWNWNKAFDANEIDDDDYPEPIVVHKRERAEALRRYGQIS